MTKRPDDSPRWVTFYGWACGVVILALVRWLPYSWWTAFALGAGATLMVMGARALTLREVDRERERWRAQ